MPTITINNKPLYYEMYGGGKPLLLLHGAMMNSQMWQPIMTDLKLYTQVITPDLYGYGKSKLAESRTIDHVADMKALLDALNITSVSILGFSMTGEVATEFALQYPQMVDNLILVSSGLRGYDYPPEAWWEPFIKAVRAKNFEKAKDIFCDEFVDGKRFKARPKDKAMLRAVMDSYDFCHFLDDTLEFKEYPMAIDQLARIQCQTMVMVGDDDDPVYDKIADVLVNGILDARKVSFSRCSHYVHVQNPDGFLEELLNFVAV